MKNTNLGNPITRYFIKELRWIDLLRDFLPLLIVAFSPIAFGLYRTLYGYSSFGPAAAAAWGQNWFLVGAVLVLFLLFYTLRRLRKTHTWIDIYQWGLFFNFPAGRKKIIPWEDIAGITSYSVTKSFLGISGKTRQYLHLFTRNNKKTSCHPDLQDWNGLKKTIKKQVYQRLRPHLLQLFQAGEVIPFGAILISKDKLYLSNQEIPWDYIKDIKVDKGVFVINLTEQKKIEIPIKNIINLEILINMIKTEI
jgi:hypothetical protein